MRTVARALAVFDCFSAARPTLSLKEIGAGLRLAKSTTFRLVQSLEELGYLVRFENNQYSLSFKFVSLAGLVESTLDIRQIARPLMKRLAHATQESVTLSTVVGSHRVCIDVVTTPAPLMSITKVGEHNVLGTGATSLILMAYLPDEDLKKASPAALKKFPYTKRTLLSVLADVRKRRYAVSHGGRIAGLSGVAVPVTNAEGIVQYCLTIVLPSARVGDRLSQLVQFAVRVGGQLSRRLGAPTPAIPAA